MLRGNHTMIVGVVLLIPMMLGFVGVGALLHIAVRVAVAQHQAAVDDAGEQIEHDKSRAAKLLAAIRELQLRIAEIRDRLDQAEDQRAELARLEEELARCEQQRETLERELNDLENRIGTNEQHREELQAERDEARSQLDALTREIARLRNQIAQMERAANPGGRPPEEGQSRADLEAEVARIQRDLETQRQANREVEQQWQGIRQQPTDPNIRIDRIIGSVNWQPPSNPLYVECDSRGVVLQPEDKTLTAHPAPAVRDQFVQQARQRRYVLFLIRPDGFDTFARYRRLVVENNVMYGYEPINQKGRVEYPK